MAAGIQQSKSKPETLQEVNLRPLLEKAREFYVKENFAQAEETCKFILSSFPNQPDALNFLALTYKSLGQFERAVQCYHQLLSTNPTYVRGLYNFANLVLEMKHVDQAIELYQSALRHDPRHVPSAQKLTQCLLDQGLFGEAFETIWNLLKQEPRGFDHWNLLSKCIYRKPDMPEDPAFLDFLEGALSNPEAPKMAVYHAVTAYLIYIVKPIQYLFFTAADKDVATYSEMLRNGELFSCLNYPALLSLMKTVQIASAEMELVLSTSRAVLLEYTLEGTYTEVDARGQRILAALATQCHLNEFVYFISEKEKEQLLGLKTTFDAMEASTAASYLWPMLMLGCYQPLHTLPGIEKALQYKDSFPDFVRDVLESFVVEPLERIEIAKTIPQLTGISDNVSKAVREQYEENPYPRWRSEAVAAPARPADIMTQIGYGFDASALSVSDSPQVLIAGTGTGMQSTNAAQRFLNSTVFGVDLSVASLAYAEWMRRKLRQDNLSYVQGDILELEGVEKIYDIIECTGVLHHMADPKKGWKILTDKLKKGGLMKIALYSRMARKDVIDARMAIAEEGYGESPEEIRRFRNDRIWKAIAGERFFFMNLRDFYSLSECRDLLFHRQERQYDLLEIDTILQELGLEFIAFEMPGGNEAKLYRQRFPADTGMTSLQNWHKLERENPTMFIGMYQFWLYKK